MKKADKLTTLADKIEGHRARIAAERDALRETLADGMELLSCCEGGEEDIAYALTFFRQGIERISEQA